MSKKCILCGKTFENSNYQLFGKSCFNKICKLLDITIPKSVKEKNKEKYLCSLIAKKLNKKSLTTRQKQWLTELYIVNLYIDKIEYVNLNGLKKKIQKQIDNMNFFTGLFLPNKDLTMVLYSIYNVYNATENFKTNLADIEQMYIKKEIDENEKKDKKVIQYFQYMFKVRKNLNPKEYALGYYRQYIFWNAVINGGLLFNYKLAAKLLRHSLSEIGENPKTYNVTDKNIIENIKNDNDLTEKLDEIIKNHETELHFKTQTDEEKEKIIFENNTDLKFAIHNAQMIVEGTRNKENKWDLSIEILDRFDFTDFVFPEEYNNKYDEISKDENKDLGEKAISSAKNGLGYTLNNIALASVQYGVLKEYDVKINFNIDNYGKDGD